MPILHKEDLECLIGVQNSCFMLNHSWSRFIGYCCGQNTGSAISSFHSQKSSLQGCEPRQKHSYRLPATFTNKLWQRTAKKKSQKIWNKEIMKGEKCGWRWRVGGVKKEELLICFHLLTDFVYFFFLVMNIYERFRRASRAIYWTL